MKLEQLHAIAQDKSASIMMMLALEGIRAKSATTIRGVTGKPSARNREALRASRKGSPNSAFGHIYSGTVDPAVIAKRRAANKEARRARAINRRRGAK